MTWLLNLLMPVVYLLESQSPGVLQHLSLAQHPCWRKQTCKILHGLVAGGFSYSFIRCTYSLRSSLFICSCFILMVQSGREICFHQTDCKYWLLTKRRNPLFPLLAIHLFSASFMPAISGAFKSFNYPVKMWIFFCYLMPGGSHYASVSTQPLCSLTRVHDLEQKEKLDSPYLMWLNQLTCPWTTAEPLCKCFMAYQQRHLITCPWAHHLRQRVVSHKSCLDTSSLGTGMQCRDMEPCRDSKALRH